MPEIHPYGPSWSLNGNTWMTNLTVTNPYYTGGGSGATYGGIQIVPQYQQQITSTGTQTLLPMVVAEADDVDEDPLEWLDRRVNEVCERWAA